ncbi:LacI family DNA-binding transcriptional regulator [Micromonospora sp. NPDC047074]|uniref:LacI family DNA-binding transcriptional regulator n=1 Tax=Micromonospora sp. NPDC047074 TaxID=3154339 RepID=UPI0033CA5F68
MAGAPTRQGGRITQRDIARRAGVSQTTVSLVLTNNSEAASRIAPATRERVLQVIRETGYVADPLARSLLRRRNQILGIFTYEPVFPAGSADFYHPFLGGIEACAETLGCDLLLFTSAPVTDGTRRIFHENNRLRLADGCVLLGREIPREELTRLVREGHAIVSVGRRDDVDTDGTTPGRVPFVGADYAGATSELARRAVALGHRRIAYVGAGSGVESAVDRLDGLRAVAPDTLHERGADREPAELLAALLAAGVTAVFCEQPAVAVALSGAALARGLRVPEDLSLVGLGEEDGPGTRDLPLTRLRIPRREMGWQSVEVLTEILHGTSDNHQRLLPCALVPGQTLAPPRT